MPILSFMRIGDGKDNVEFVNPATVVRIYQTTADSKAAVSTVELINGTQIRLEGSPEDLALKFSGTDDCPPILSLKKQQRGGQRS